MYDGSERDGRGGRCEAAEEAGVRLTLLDACYLHGGIGTEPSAAQRRFCDRDVDAWAARVDRL